MLKALPDTAPMDPKRMAEIVAAAVDKAPSAESFITEAKNEEINQPTETPAPKKSSEGFKVADETAGEKAD